MKGLVRAIGLHPRLTLALMTVGTLVAVAGLPRIRFDSSLTSLTVPDDPVRAFNDEVRAQFGDEEIGVVAVLAPDVYSVDVVRGIEDLTEKLARVHGVSRTLSITNASDPTADVFDPPRLLDRGPVTEASVARLRERVASNPIYIPNLVAADGSAAAVTIFFDRATTAANENAVDSAVESVLDAYEGPAELHYTGMSHIRVRAVELMQGDLRRFLPISLLFMMLVLRLSFASWRATIFPLFAVCAGVTVLMGTMGWVGVPITMTTLVLPSLLLVIGGSYAVHVVDAYLIEAARASGKGVSGADLLARTLRVVGVPVAVSAFTTAVGFGSLAFHPIPAIAGLGKYAVLGIGIVALGCLFGAPLAFSVFSRERLFGGWTRGTDRLRVRSPRLDHFIAALGSFSIDHRIFVFGVSLAVFAISLLGASKIKVDTDFLKAFRPDSDVRRDHDAVAGHLVGPHPISVVVTAPTAGYFKAIAPLRQIKDFQDFLESLDQVDESISLIDYLEELDLGLQRSGGGLEVNDKGELVEAPAPPSFWDAPKEQLPQIFQLVAASPRTFSGLVDPDFRRLNITLRTTISGSREVLELRKQIDAFTDAMMPRGVTVQLAGGLIIMAEAANRIIGGQVESLAIAFSVIFAILAVMFLSLRVGLAAMIPNVLPVVVFFGVMGWLGVELNLATSIIGAVALGIAVDDTIHYMARLNRIVKRAHTQRDALLLTLRTVGRPVFVTSLTLTAGFAVMTVSQFTLISAFGWLSAVTMLTALLTNLTLLPAILATVPVVSVWDLVSYRLGPSPHLTIPLFQGLGRFAVRVIVLLGRLNRFERGSYIVRRGDEAHEMYLILEGEAEVHLESGKTVPLARGGIVGEMALLRHSRRAADVIALTRVEVLAIDEDFLRRLRVRYPRFAARFFINIARILSDRLEAANRR